MSKYKYRPDMKRKHMGFLKMNRKNHPLYEGVNIIGRDAKAIVLLKDVKFSKQHAMISILDESTQFISDLCSSNGTKLDDSFLVPYKLYQLTEENLITFSDVTGTYHKLTVEPKIPESQITGDSQICDHFALTQKLPKEMTENIHDCPTQIYDSNNSIIANTQKPTSEINIQGLSIHEAETQKCVTSTHDAVTQSMEISQNNQNRSPMRSANQEESIHDLETQNLAASTQSTVTPQTKTTDSEIDNTQIYDDVFAYDSFRQSLSTTDGSMYGVEVDDTLVTADKPKIIACEEDCDMLTESPTQDFVATQPSPNRPYAQSPKLSQQNAIKFKHSKNQKNSSGSETDIEDNVSKQKLFGKLSELKQRILKKKAAKSAESKKMSPNTDSETDCEDNNYRALNTSPDSQRIIVKPKNRKIIRSDSETDMTANLVQNIDDDSATDIEDNLELIKQIDEASKTIDNSAEQKSPMDDDSLTDIEDNLELIKKIDEASRSNNNKISPETQNFASIETNITEVTSVSRHNTPEVIAIEDDNSTDDDLDYLRSTQKCSILDSQSTANIKSMRNDLDLFAAATQKLKPEFDTDTCSAQTQKLLAQNQLNRTNDEDLDIFAAATQKLKPEFDTDIRSAQTQRLLAQNQLNRTNDEDLDIFAAATQKLNPEFDTDIFSAQTQKLNECDFAEDMNLPPAQLLAAIKLEKCPNYRKSIPDTQDIDFLAPTQLATRPTQDSATIETQTQDVDFLAPTQLLESYPVPKSKPIYNESQINEDNYLAPTQVLLPSPEKYEPEPSTSKQNKHFYFGVDKHISSNTAEVDSLFDAPTQKLSIPLQTFEVHNAQTQILPINLDAPAQQLFMTQKDHVNTKSICDTPTRQLGSGDRKSSNAILDGDEYEFTTITLPSNPNRENQNITVASTSESMRLHMSEINEDDLQPKQDAFLSTSNINESSSTPKNTELAKTETNVNQNEIDLKTTVKSICSIANQTEPETQLEVDFNQSTQKLYIEKETSRPNNPVANMFDEEDTQTQNTEATPNIKKIILSPKGAKFNSNNENDPKLLESTAVLLDRQSLDNIDPKPLQTNVESGRTKRSARSAHRSSIDSDEIVNNQNDSPSTSKVTPAKRSKLNSETSLVSNQESSNDKSLEEEELVNNNKRQKKSTWKVMEMKDTRSSSKGRKTETPNRRSTRKASTAKVEMDKRNSSNNVSTSKSMGDVSNEKNKQNQAVDYNQPSTSKAGMGDASSVGKTRTSAIEASPLRTSTRIKRKSKYAPRSDSDEPIPIIEDADDWRCVESYIDRKALKVDDSESEYTSSSNSTAETRRHGRAHKIDDYSSDDTGGTNSTAYTSGYTPITKRQKFEPLHVINQPQINITQHKVVFTMLNDEQLEEKVEKLGGTVTDNIYTCTVLVTNKVSRSLKFLIAVGLGKPIAKVDWIKESMKKKRFLDPWNFLLDDIESEAIFEFTLKDSLHRAFNKKLLCGYTVLLAVNKNFDVLKEIIEAGGGRVISRAPVKPPVGKFIVVGYKDERRKFARYLKQSAPVVSAEAIFSGVLQQKINVNKHLL